MDKKAAECLLKIKAVYLRPEQPFTWASGIKSPIYCDNRIVLSYPDERGVIEDGLAELIRKEFKNAEAVFGTATAGIGPSAMVAERMNLPTGYVRGENKSHGQQNRIGGQTRQGRKGRACGGPYFHGRKLFGGGGSVARSGRGSPGSRVYIHLQH